MDKVYINSADEDWIVDKFKYEFLDFNSKIITRNIEDADIIWIISPWTWKQLPKEKLKLKKVILTIHHLDNNDLMQMGLLSLAHAHVIGKIAHGLRVGH